MPKALKFIFGAIYRYFKKLDKQLFTAVCAVSMFSVVLMYSIYKNGITDGSAKLYQVQFIAVCLGAFTALVMSALDYHKFVKLWFLYAPVALGGTLLTFTSLGYKSYETVDDKAWLDLGFITFQPSEFLKAAFIMTFALHLSKLKDKINSPLSVLTLILHAGVPLGVVVLQGDDGTATVFAVITVCMVFAAGISWRYILPACAALPPAVWFLWNNVMSDSQKLRFLVLFSENPETDPRFKNVYFQQYWGKIALGSGHVFGKGLFAEEYVFVPETRNDFILSYVGQCFGFIGCIGLVAALTYICLKIIADSRLAKDDLGKYICVGVYSLIFIHCVLNIGMVLDVMPVIGVPLPFVSQGGTNMLSLYICIGLVMSVYSHSEKNYRVFYDAK